MCFIIEQHFNGRYNQSRVSMALVNPNQPNVLINFRSDDPEIQTDVNVPQNVTFQFNRIVQIPSTMKAQISVLNAQIPNTQYTLDTDVTVVYAINGLLALSTTLAAGHYTVCSFKKEMARLLEVDPHKDELPNWAASDAYSCRTGKWKLQRTTAAPGDVWSINFTATDSQKKMLARMMGIRPVGPWPIYSNTAGYWASVFTVDFTRSHNYYVCSSTLTPASVDSNRHGAEWVLAKIPITSPWLSMVSYTGSQRVGCLHSAEYLDRVNISIRDHENEIVNLQGVRWNLSLLIEFVDRRKPTMYSKKWDQPRLETAGRQLKELMGETTALPPQADTPLEPKQVKRFSEAYKRWYAKQSRKTRKAIQRALRSQGIVESS